MNSWKIGFTILALAFSITAQPLPRRLGSFTSLSNLWSSIRLDQSALLRKQIAGHVLPTLVRIEALNSKGKPWKMGSGFVVRNDGWILTNYHVIEGAHRLAVRFVQGDRVFEAVGVGPFNKYADWALIKISAVNLPALELSPARAAQGESVLAFGNPSGLDGTMTEGMVNRIAIDGAVMLIQHTALISGGSSGGPLVNQRGMAVGINVGVLKAATGFGFAVDIKAVPNINTLGEERLAPVAIGSGAKSSNRRSFGRID